MSILSRFTTQPQHVFSVRFDGRVWRWTRQAGGELTTTSHEGFATELDAAQAAVDIAQLPAYRPSKVSLPQHVIDQLQCTEVIEAHAAQMPVHGLILNPQRRAVPA